MKCVHQTINQFIEVRRAIHAAYIASSWCCTACSDAGYGCGPAKQHNTERHVSTSVEADCKPVQFNPARAGEDLGSFDASTRWRSVRSHCQLMPQSRRAELSLLERDVRLVDVNAPRSFSVQAKPLAFESQSLPPPLAQRLAESA